jgi:hypothetical protein
MLLWLLQLLWLPKTLTQFNERLPLVPEVQILKLTNAKNYFSFVCCGSLCIQIVSFEHGG